jgi:fructose-bisphosphate aldolase class II
MQTYREILEDAQKSGIAIGHFNYANFEMYWGVVNAAKKLNVPVILGLAEGERDWVGIKEAVAMVAQTRASGVSVFLNADHTYSYERVCEAIDAGFDSVIYDGAKLGVEENTKITKSCVEYARKVGADTGRDIIIEAELGYIGEGSSVRDELPTGIQTADPEAAAKFVKETGIDMFAPAVGNVHGMMRTGSDPAIDTDLVSQIAKSTGVPLVLHGGSGTPNLGESVKAGISVVHISTEIRKAWHDAMKVHLDEFDDDIAPYKVGKGALEAIEKVTEARLKLFTNP